MDPSAELLQLLREIRDSQRELLVMMKSWEERSEKLFVDGKKAQEDWIRRQEADRAKWREENKLYWRQVGWGRRVTIVSVVILLLIISGGMVIGIMRSFGYLK